MSLDPTPVAQLLQEAVAGGAVPGASALLATTEDAVEAHAGSTAVDGGAPVGPDTMYRYASCTKAIASVAALQLIEQGKVKLDEPVATYVPAFAELQVLDGFDGDEPVLRAPIRPATVRELMTHTSGLSYMFTNAKTLRFHELTGTPHVLTGVRSALLDVPLAGDPGQIWDYSTGADWLGLLIEAVSGQGFDAYLADHVTGPLGMTDTTFTPSEEQRSRLMGLYGRTPEGGLAALDLDLVPEPEFWAGGHGLHGTARDYGRFLRMLLRGGELDGERVLTEETVDLAFENHLGGATLPGAISSAMPELSNDVPALPFKQGWGLGLHLTLEDIPGMRRAGSGDWAGLFNLYYWVDRRSGVAGMWLSQLLPFFDLQVVGTFAQVEAAAYAQLGVAA